MKKVYKKNVLAGLNDLASYAFQKTAWFPNNQGLSSDFADDVSAVFESSGLEEALYAEVVFGRVADDALRELNEICECIGYNRSEEELIDSLEMQLVRDKAAEALALVKASSGAGSTVEIVE